MAFVLALDQGTTSSRAILFDHGGAVQATARREFPQIFPRPGWVEHDAEQIWSTQLETARAVLAEAGISPGDVAGIGITNQRETTVVWDRATGAPIHNAIVWQDRRTASACDRLRADGHADMVSARTGLVIDAYFSATKVAWLLNNIPGAREKAAAGELAFGTIDSWLVYRLTDGELHVTDPSNASRTMLYDIHAGDWSDELLGLFDIPRSMMPAVVPSSAIYGTVAPSLNMGSIPIAGIVGDQQAALMGQLCLDAGLSKNTYGTGCFMLMNTGPVAKTSRNKLLTTVAWNIGDRTTYALEGSVFVGGAVVQWLRDGLGIIASSEEIEPLAESVEDNGGVHFVPAFAGLGAPYWDPYARGVITGLTRGTTRGHIARAALEGIAFEVADLFDAMEADAPTDSPELRVDGGASANDLLLQFQADLLRLPVVRPTVVETTALGAAYMAGLAVGYWTDTTEMEANWQVDRRFEPLRSDDEAAALRAAWSDAVERSMGLAPPDEHEPQGN